MNKETTLPSGLIIVEHEQPKPIPEPNKRPNAKCAVCGKEATEPIMPLMWKTGDGFRIEWPTCGHGKFATCPECYEKSGEKTQGCPVCGSHEFYT